MKRLILKLSAFIATMILMSSCTGDGKMAQLLKHVPSTADFVFVGDVHNVLESAGGSTEQSKIKLPSVIMEIMDSGSANNLDEFNDFLKDSGIDIDACGVFFSYRNDGPEHPVLVFSLTDRKKFIDAIENEGYSDFDDENGVAFYKKKTYESSTSSEYDDYSYFAVGDDFGYWIQDVWVGSDFKPQKVLSGFVDDLKDGTFADTPLGGYAGKGNAMGLAAKMPEGREFKALENLPIGAFCMYADLDGDALTFTTKCLDRDGKDIKEDMLGKFCDIKAKVNSDALSFLGKDEAMVWAVSIKDFKWDKLIEYVEQQGGISRSERAMASAVTSYLEKIDGTIAVGLGVTDGLNSFYKLAMEKDVFTELSATIVVETKEGKGKTVLSDIMGLMEQQNVPFSETTDGFEISDIPDVTLYAKRFDDVLVFSNHPIKKDAGNDVAKQVKFTDHMGAFAIVLNHKDKLLQDLAISNDIKVTAFSDEGGVEGKMTLEITGGKGKGGVLAKLMQIIKDVYDNRESLMQGFNSQRDDYGSRFDYDVLDEVDYDDYADADTVAYYDED